jgi:glycerate 2-kinase
MQRSAKQLRDDAMAIWQAGVAAVDSERLVTDQVVVDGESLIFGDETVDLNSVRKIVVVGAGKAGAGMATGLERALGDSLMAEKELSGWVNVPDDCVRSLSRIHLHGARPPGVNEPTKAGVEGTTQILRAAANCAADDLCICLFSGGGSALLPAPIDGVSLTDKLEITKHLSAAGANIQELNTVRKQLSRIKGGGLAAACNAGRLFTLIISDVISDPLDVIASGPTVPDTSTPQQGLLVLEKFGARQAGISQEVFNLLAAAAGERDDPATSGPQVRNFIIGNNATAVDAAGIEAERRGYSHAMTAARSLEGRAEDVGRHLAEMALRMREESGPDCLITGGEPVVELVDASRRGKGGRNQQLVLAALDHVLDKVGLELPASEALRGIALLAGGTDGEDGPTDAAGAMVDEIIGHAMDKQQLLPAEFLNRNDAYHFFAPLQALIKTGPTHTNVCDLRVVTIAK